MRFLFMLYLLCALSWGPEEETVVATAALAEPDVEQLSQASRDSILADFSQHLLRREARLRTIPLLNSREKRAMRTSRNDCHLAAASRLGIEHNTSHGEAELRCLDGATEFYVEYDCHARLTSDAVASLDLVGRYFHAALAELGLPPVRYAISSAYRSQAYQRRLTRINRNATRSTSSHEFGTTFDITYRRFYGPTSASIDPAAYALAGDIRDACLAEELALAERAWAAQMSERYASRFAAVLGRVLTDLEGEGTLLVLRERRQPCYHITIARRLLAPGSHIRIATTSPQPFAYAHLLKNLSSP